MKFNLTSVPFLVASVFLLAAPITAKAETSAAPTAATKSCEMKIEGMTCGSCEAKVKSAVKDMTLSAEIDPGTGMGKMTYAEGKTTCDDLAKKVTEIGYKATVVK